MCAVPSPPVLCAATLPTDGLRLKRAKTVDKIVFKDYIILVVNCVFNYSAHFLPPMVPRFKVGYVMSLLRRYSAKLCRITLGFAAMALGMAIAKQSYCLSPWNILNDGISHTFSITIGQANIIVGLVILALDLLLRETFGFSGTPIQISVRVREKRRR